MPTTAQNGVGQRRQRIRESKGVGGGGGKGGNLMQSIILLIIINWRGESNLHSVAFHRSVVLFYIGLLGICCLLASSFASCLSP